MSSFDGVIKEAGVDTIDPLFASEKA